MGKKSFLENFDPAQMLIWTGNASEYECFSNGVNAIDILSMMSQFFDKIFVFSSHFLNCLE